MGSFTRRLWIAVSLVLLFFSVLVSAKEKNVLELTSREVEGLLQVCFLEDFFWKVDMERLLTRSS